MEHTRNLTRAFPRNFSSHGGIVWRKKIRIPTKNLMRKQIQKNEIIGCPIPAVRSTSYIITRSLVEILTTDKNFCTALVCCTERTRRRTRNFRNAARNKYESVQKVVKFCSGSFLATISLATQSYLLQNTATNTDKLCTLYKKAGFMSSFHYFVLFFSTKKISRS